MSRGWVFPYPKHARQPLMVQLLSKAYQLDTVDGYNKRLDQKLRCSMCGDMDLNSLTNPPVLTYLPLPCPYLVAAALMADF